MTITEYEKALIKLEKEGKFAAYRTDFGGTATTVEAYVRSFVHAPEHERRICQLLQLPTQEERQVKATRMAGWGAVLSAVCTLVSLVILGTSIYLNSR